MNSFRFDQKPVMAYWEITRACDLACAHCRAEAIPRRDPRELNPEESRSFLHSLLEFGEKPPHLVITGGDPLSRPDLFDLLAYGRSIGLEVALAPSVTPRLTDEMLKQLTEVGVRTISLSLDGSDAAAHDGLRGVPGCYVRTMHALQVATALGLQVQINTLITQDTITDLLNIYGLLKDAGIMRWSLFFLISTGRGSGLRPVLPEQAEELCQWIADNLDRRSFPIVATEAPQYRRVLLRRLLDSGMTLEQVTRRPLGRGFGVRDGNGVVFVSHTGDVCPSGFLPLPAGNVRGRSLAEIYRHAPLFTDIRDPDRYVGKCGRCSYREICGGSRARAYAATGDCLGSDPMCMYQPSVRSE